MMSAPIGHGEPVKEEKAEDKCRRWSALVIRVEARMSSARRPTPQEGADSTEEDHALVVQVRRVYQRERVCREERG